MSYTYEYLLNKINIYKKNINLLIDWKINENKIKLSKLQEKTSNMEIQSFNYSFKNKKNKNNQNNKLKWGIFGMIVVGLFIAYTKFI